MSETILIREGLVFTADDNDRIIEKGEVLIQGNRILEVGKEVPKEKYKIDSVIDAKNHVVLPGLVNTHFHSTMFLRGVLEDLKTSGLTKFLEEFYYPMLESLTPEDVYDQAMLSYLESLKCGTTTVNDMYVHLASCASAARDSGIRAFISSEAADLVPGQENLQANEEAFRQKNNTAEGRVKIWFGAEWVPVCSPEFFLKTRELANKYHTGIHVHLNETLYEIEQCKKQFGKRPVEHVYDLGLLGKDAVAAHCVWLTDKEIKIFKETGANIATCPIINMKMGEGIARVHDILTAGVSIGIGTDAGGNSLDMFDAMKYTSCFQRGSRVDPAALPDYRMAFSMATIGGAKVMGSENEIGSIQPGKKADIILVDLKHPRFQPVLYGKFFNVHANLVYAGHGDNVDTVIVDGKVLIQDRVFKTIEEDRILEKANKSAERVMSRL